MARIEPMPWEYLTPEQSEQVRAGIAIGMQSKESSSSRVFAYSSAAFRSMKQANLALFRKGVIEPRLQELLRLRSANLNQCEPCAAARKEDSVNDDDVACLIDPMLEGLSPRERMAVSFLDRMADDYESIDDATFVALRTQFSTAEIVELGWRCALLVGGHRFMHCLDILGAGPPVIAFDPDEIDRSTAEPVAAE